MQLWNAAVACGQVTADSERASATAVSCAAPLPSCPLQRSSLMVQHARGRTPQPGRLVARAR